MSSILIKPVLHVVYRASSETFIGVIVYSLGKHYAILPSITDKLSPNLFKRSSMSFVAKRNLNGIADSYYF
jgi:hypothetical protein